MEGDANNRHSFATKIPVSQLNVQSLEQLNEKPNVTFAMSVL